jgi:hypothetical protein
MTEERTIAVADVQPDMQIHSAGLWWLVVTIVEDGSATGTMMLTGRRVRADQSVTKGTAALLWLPITRFGVRARAGRPKQTTVLADGHPRRVVWRPRYVGDRKPYVDSKAVRWMPDETMAHRRLSELGAAFRQAAAL